MGSGSYSFEDRTMRATTRGFASKSVHEIFEKRSLDNSMSPKGVTLRESRDSEEHPNTVPIVIALDLTGSMNYIPKILVSEGLPNIMKGIMEKGIKDPQILFLGVGDHECDRAPLQVGQFESNDELLDKWLTSTYLEGGGGGNAGESYLLAWYFAALKTSIDSFEKRSKKGILFTIGDEPTLKYLSKESLKAIMGNGEHKNYEASELLSLAQNTYEVYHLHIKEGSNGRKESVISGWKELMGDNLIVVEDHKDVAKIIADIVTSKVYETTSQEASQETSQETVKVDFTSTEDDSIL